MVFIQINNLLKYVELDCYNEGFISSDAIIHHINKKFEKLENFYLCHNGQLLLRNQSVPQNGIVRVCPKLLGGKGGFGSMLRAIGAQIEKTTNREACRDLSGRRLRDINEEQRLKKWLSKESDRQAEKMRKRKERLEKLKSKPRHNFVDFEYEKERSELPEKVDAALSEGMQKASKGVKRTSNEMPSTSKKKKLWMDEDLSDSDSDSVKSKESSEETSESKEMTSSIEDSGESNSCSSLVKIETARSELTPSGTNIETNFQEAQAKEIVTGDVLTTSQTDDTKALEKKQKNVEKNIIADETHKTGTKNENDSNFDLMSFQSASEIEALGLETLKLALVARGLKCGGSVGDRAERLWKVRGLKPEDYPSNLLSKNKKMNFV